MTARDELWRPVTTMGKTTLRLLGGLEILNAAGEPVSIPGRKLQALLVFLATNRNSPPTRDALVGMFWPDRFDQQARQSLRQSISRLRKIFGDDDNPVLQSEGNHVSLDDLAVEIDVRTFERLIKNGSADALSEALALYKGPLADGVHVDGLNFQEWIGLERTRLHEMACAALWKLARDQADNANPNAAISSAQQIIALEPLHEEAHRLLMQLYAGLGQQVPALQQYQRLSALLLSELGVRPDARTQRLYEDIRANRQIPEPAGNGNAGHRRASPIRKLKIAVLPFVNMADDGGRDFFVNGINEDIVAALTRNRWMSVMGHNTTMALSDRREDMVKAAREFGAQYTLDGSVRRDGERVRVAVQLIDIETAESVWAEHFDRDLNNLISVQDDIAKTIAATVEPELAANEGLQSIAKQPENLDAWGSYHIGLLHMYKFTKEDNIEAQRLFRQAIEIDAGYALAHARLSYALVMSVIYFEADATPDLLDEALKLAEIAVRLDDRDAVAQFTLGRVHLVRGEYPQSIASFETALEFNPCLAHSHCGLGDTVAYQGMPADSIPNFEEAIRLSPYDPYRWAFMMYGAMARLFMHDHESAAKWGRDAVRVPNSHYWANAVMVAALGHLERPDEARVAVTELLRRKPDFSCGFARERLFYLKDQTQLEHYVSGLKKAGIPD
ncbi:MAG: tetratricopeptide repeat protein [Rhodospirillaceae bacterium]|nr:tetratricopeptide repeat protein [Rhodospirillaceae bacterium]